MGISAWLGAIRDVALPRGCAGCDLPDAVVCDRCRTLLDGMLAFDMPGTAWGRGYACAWYRGAVRRVILGWKDHHDEECDGPLSDAMASLVARCPIAESKDVRPLMVVPAPSSASSMRRRGRRHTHVLARAVAAACLDMGVEARMVPALAMDHVRGRSVQMSGGQRSRRIHGHVVVRHPESCRDANVVIVDDIVTTGATMRQCVEALRSSGARVVTCLSLAHTPRPDSSMLP